MDTALAVQPFDPFSNFGNASSSSATGNGSSTLSPETLNAIAMLEQDILQYLSTQKSNSSDNTQSMLEDILQVLQQLLQNNQAQSGSGSGSSAIGQTLQELIAMVSQLLEGEGQQGAGDSSSGSMVCSDPLSGFDGTASSGGASGMSAGTIQTMLQNILDQLLQMEDGQSANTSGSPSGSGSSQDLGILQEIEQLLQQLLGGQGQSGNSSGAGSGAGSGDLLGSGSSGSGPDGLSPIPPLDTSSLQNVAANPSSDNGSTTGSPGASSGTPSVGNDASSGNSSNSSVGGDTKAIIEQRLTSDLGLDADERAAVGANVEQESNWESDVNEGGQRGAPNGDVAEDNADGYGAFQLSGDQKKQFLDYCTANNKNPADINAQMDFLEQDPQFTDAINAMKNAKANGASLHDLTLDFTSQFEKAADPQMGNRYAYADQLAADNY